MRTNKKLSNNTSVKTGYVRNTTTTPSTSLSKQTQAISSPAGKMKSSGGSDDNNRSNISISSLKSSDKPNMEQKKKNLSVDNSEIEQVLFAAKETLKKNYPNDIKTPLSSINMENFYIIMIILGLAYCHYLLVYNIGNSMNNSNMSGDSKILFLPILILLGYSLLLHFFYSKKNKHAKAMELVSYSESLLSQKNKKVSKNQA